ncbi:hypothetical protein E1A91_A09G138600v1 [Gossypium mustelinum]|uniref:Uncharacterized protein n=1 Tax=Gossypium mustelinum TaxID=34275 RepID=A0A5D2XXU9_GOSMU|nr:hypothetical protein E1A91_A09G138600v1 [Gossypium mustelinum]
MPGLARRNERYSNASFAFWSKHSDDVGYIQPQQFWKLIQTLFEQARKNMYCSRCNGLLLEGFLQIVMYGKSLQQEKVAGNLHSNRSGISKNQIDGGLSMTDGSKDEIQDPSVHPWGGLTTTRDGSLTLLDSYLSSESLDGLQNVFDSARERERERELLYPDACGGGGRGWISQGIASYGRGHGAREACALHTSRLSCDTFMDFWSALGEETQQSLLRMKEEDFIERLIYRCFDGKRFCRDCRRNVIHEFKELKELKRMRREPQCISWFCAADTAFLYEVSDDRVQADWHQTFADTYGTYHHFEWAVETGVGKSDIMEFENVGMKGSVEVNGLDLDCLNSCYITPRAWKLDGRCSELSVKAHALKGQQCVHCRLVVGNGYVRITTGGSIRRFFKHAEEAEEEEDDGSIDKDGNELDGECSLPQKHAKSPELARQFLLDAATVIFKEQVKKAFREGTARQNAQSIFICLALKLLEGRVHVACKEIITLEKQKKRRKSVKKKNARRGKEQKNKKKKHRRKERLNGKAREKEKYCSVSSITSVALDVSNEESSRSVEVEENVAINCKDSVGDTGDIIVSRPDFTNVEEQFVNGHSPLSLQNQIFDSPDGDGMERLKFRKDGQFDSSLKRCARRQVAVVSESAPVHRSQPRYQGQNFEAPSRSINGLNRQLKISSARSSGQLCGVKCTEKFQCSNSQSDRYNCYSCSCYQHNEYRAKMMPHVSATRVGREPKSVSKSESALDMSKQVPQGNKYNMQDYIREDCGKLKNKIMVGAHHSARDSLHCKKVWGAIGAGPDDNFIKSSGATWSSEGSVNLGETDHEHSKVIKSRNSSLATNEDFHVEKQDECLSLNAAYEEIGIYPNRNPTLNGSSLSMISWKSSSDNFSCYDLSNTSSSNHGNLGSSSTSDSEDASQQSAGRDTSLYTKNGFSECQFGHSPDGRGNKNPVSWPATPANGLMPFPPNPYLYTAALGYGSNGNSPLCMPYSTLLHLRTPLFNPGSVPIYRPISNVNGLYAEQIQFPEPGTEKEALPEVNSKGVPGRLQVTEQARKEKFGGPVALSTGCKSNLVPLKDEIVVVEHSSQFSADHVENNHACNKKESTIEEYNLFAASNGLRFSLFKT